MFVTLKSCVNVRADGTVPTAMASVSTFPETIGVDVPGWLFDPGVTEK